MLKPTTKHVGYKYVGYKPVGYKPIGSKPVGYGDSGNPYASGSNKDPGRKAPRIRVGLKSKGPGSLWAHGSIISPRKKDLGSNLALKYLQNINRPGHCLSRLFVAIDLW